MTNLLGYHYVGKSFSEAQVAAHLDHLRATKPAWITVHGAEQYREALAFSKQVRREIPETRVIFRHCINRTEPGGAIIDSRDDDTGRHARMTAQSWWDNIGARYIGSDLTILTDNESGAEDLTYYSQWQAKVMDLAALHGVSLAVGRFSVLNPPERQWTQLDEMWRALDTYHHLMVWSPNVYFSDTNFDGIEHIFGGWRRCADLEIRSPKTVIGEFAYCQNLDPHRGYKAVQMDSAEYVRRLIDQSMPFYSAEIPVCIYSIGEWPIGADTFSLDAAALKALRERASGKPPVIEPPYPALPASSDPRWTPHTIQTVKDGVRMRSQPTDQVSNNILTSLKGTHLIFTIDGLKYDRWQAVKFAGFIGWVHSDYYSIVNVTPPPTPADTITRLECEAIVQREVKLALEKFRLELIEALTGNVTEVKQEKIA